MTIKFTVEATDDNTEHLIAYLDERYKGYAAGAPDSEKVRILKCALKWLALRNEGTYFGDETVNFRKYPIKVGLEASDTNQEVDVSH